MKLFEKVANQLVEFTDSSSGIKGKEFDLISNVVPGDDMIERDANLEHLLDRINLMVSEFSRLARSARENYEIGDIEDVAKIPTEQIQYIFEDLDINISSAEDQPFVLTLNAVMKYLSPKSETQVNRRRTAEKVVKDRKALT